jgi:hypothetical protein
VEFTGEGKFKNSSIHFQIMTKKILCLVCLFFLTTCQSGLGIEDNPSTSQLITLPGKGFIVVADGKDESRNSGSYSIRLYSGKYGRIPFDNFAGGLVRPRAGIVEKIKTVDLDNDGETEIVVIIRSAGSPAYLSADAFSLSGGTVKLLETVSGLPSHAVPITALKEKIENYTISARENINSSACTKILKSQNVTLPDKGEIVSLNQMKQICIDYDLPELWKKIELDQPHNPFQSDSCSYWFGSWKGVSLYAACFLHDLKYWAGYPDEEVERLAADTELMIDIACLTGSTTMAETMFQGTRLGGNEMYQRSFSWGFGRK